MEWEGALQIRAQGKTRVGDDAIRALSERREDAQERGFGRMKERIVRAGGKSGDNFQNLFALAGKIRGDLGRQPIGPMASDADLNHQAWPRRRA